MKFIFAIYPNKGINLVIYFHVKIIYVFSYGFPEQLALKSVNYSLLWIQIALQGGAGLKFQHFGG